MTGPNQSYPGQNPFRRPGSAPRGTKHEGPYYRHSHYRHKGDLSAEALLNFPSGCLIMLGTTLVVAGLLALLVLTFRHPGYRATPAYQTVLGEVNGMTRAETFIGTPIRETGLIAFRADRDERGMRRHMTLRVEGPDGEATLLAIVRQVDDQVRIESLSLVHAETRETLVLLGRGGHTQPPTRKQSRGEDDFLNE